MHYIFPFFSLRYKIEYFFLFLHIIPGNDKFKVVFFDNSGHVTMVEESQQRKRKSEANLFVVPFGRYNLSETMPLTMMKRLDEEVPPVFMILGINF